MTKDETLARIEAKLDELMQVQQMNARNIFTLYRRTTALAHMVEAAAEGREPRLPMIMRAEIDASLDAEAFENLAHKDKDEFVRRYGDVVLNVLQGQGVEAISKIGEFAPPKVVQTH